MNEIEGKNLNLSIGMSFEVEPEALAGICEDAGVACLQFGAGPVAGYWLF